MCAPGSSGDVTAFQADVIGGGAELGSTLFNDVEEQQDNTSTGRLRKRELLRAAASRDQDLGAAAALHPDEDVPSDDYEAWFLSSVIANPGGVEHLEWMRLQSHKHERFLIAPVTAALHYRTDLFFRLRFFFDFRFPEFSRLGASAGWLSQLCI